MKFMDLANHYILGYSRLSKKRQSQFERSVIGLRFVKIVKNHLAAIESFQAKKGMWDWIFPSRSDKQQELESTLKGEKDTFILDALKNDEYQTLATQINQHIISEIYPDYFLLDKQQQARLGGMSFSPNDNRGQVTLRSFPQNYLLVEFRLNSETCNYNSLSEIQKISTAGTTLKNNIIDLESERTKIIQIWYESYLASPETLIFRQSIEQKKMQICLRKLEKLFPLLSVPITPSEPSPMEQLAANSMSDSFQEKLEDILANSFFHYIQQTIDNYVDFVSLHDFNQKQARQLAKIILQVLNYKEIWRQNSWFAAYEKELVSYILNSLLLVHGKEWHIIEKKKEELVNSLSYLFWHNETIDKTTKFLAKMADAHAFIQATGFSTQNESSFLAVLDLYNYGRTAESISEIKKIFMSLFKPFLPLYEEYKEIALYEKNTYKKILRTVMPLIVVASFVVLIAAILAPLAIPELAFLIAVIPALFLGLVLATKYVALKNGLYQSLRQSYYKGAFEIPEFQVNPRMIQIFGNKTAAERVRNFYIEELKICDAAEAVACSKSRNGILTGLEIEAREKNIRKRHVLCLEWYDIHSNTELGYDRVPQLVLERLHEVGDKEFCKLKERLKNTDLSEINLLVKEALADLQNNLLGPEINLDSLVEEKKPLSCYSPQLFKPSCLEPRAKLEHLSPIEDAINSRDYIGLCQ